ncbi:LysR family transcriptional regulator [Stutzerimonas stutzeri]|uniref:LysR family transcriptional regulator n=1 Tax=Stutzerimonas stutzeri TaxID=316 RepID=UPI0015E2896D|nr:LysR family transcriptional regulator [Stutzerimonas stutzeri]MBA1226339.1 LysR family transcriptional regulator [Stutzerimonas stutzeri]
MDMLHAMRAFVRVVDAGSFTAAARQTDTSTAQVSRLVSELENHLHARLLQRTTRRLALTEVGARFLERSREILAQLDDARQEACGAHLMPRGRLRVHSTTGLGIQLLSGLAGHYCERYPEVSLDLSLSQRQPDLLEAGLDVIITLSRDLPDSELIAQRLGPVFHVVCAAPSYLQRHGVPRRPTDLHDHRCLRLLDPVFADDWHFVGDGVEEVIRPGETFKVNVAEAMASAAEAGMGICLLPDYVAAPALQRGTLLRLLPQYRLQEKQIHAPSRRFLDAKIRTWLDFLAQALPRAFDDYHRVLRDETHWA